MYTNQEMPDLRCFLVRLIYVFRQVESAKPVKQKIPVVRVEDKVMPRDLFLMIIKVFMLLLKREKSEKMT